MSQDATSVHSFRKMVENNLRNLGEGKYTDYLPIGIFLTRDQADSFCVCLRQRQDQKYRSRQLDYSELVLCLSPPVAVLFRG